MFSALTQGLMTAVINLIKITLGIVVLIALIAWAKHNPVQAQAVATKAMDAVFSVIVWGCNQIINLTS
jgi:hypothetical protein